MADDAIGPPPSDSVKEFNARIEQYIRTAEAHMNLPHNTIANLLADSDFLFVVKMCAVIEPLLKEAVREKVRRNLEFFTPTAVKSETLLKAIGDLGRDQLRQIVKEFEAIDKMTNDFIYALFLVRNRYSHHITNAHVSVIEICEKVAKEKNGDRKLLPKLAGIDPNKPIEATFLRVAMFYNLAWFLRAAIHLVDPPPPAPSDTGILGRLMASEQPDH